MFIFLRAHVLLCVDNCLKLSTYMMTMLVPLYKFRHCLDFVGVCSWW